nr:MAG TPA: hypothetical protein [Caudoviricetes sp.]
MSKNLIPQIAEMLGLQLGEEFKVKGYDKVTYKFASDGLKLTYDNDIEISDLTAKVAFVALLNGTNEIVKLPWNPKIYDIYWTFKAAHRDVWCITDVHWTNNPNDAAAFKAGWVYRTRVEAEAALPKVAAEFDVKYRL